jgi:hypothetical protein
MKLSAGSETTPRVVKAGSVTVKIYTGRIGRYHTFTVYWRAAGRSHRKTFSHEKEAQKFAREQAENLAAGQVHSPSITATEVSTFREAERRLGDTAPIHVAAREYASAGRRLGDAATLNQAVEFFLHNSLRSELQRSVSEFVEEFVAMKQSDGLSERYVEDVAAAALREGLPSEHRARHQPRSGRVAAQADHRTRGAGQLPQAHRHAVQLCPSPRLPSARPRDGGSLAGEAEDQIEAHRDFLATGIERTDRGGGGTDKTRHRHRCIHRHPLGGNAPAQVENFNWGEDVIDIGADQTKTASRRLVPILPALVEWIEPQAKPYGPVLNYSPPVYRDPTHDIESLHASLLPVNAKAQTLP